MEIEKIVDVSEAAATEIARDIFDLSPKWMELAKGAGAPNPYGFIAATLLAQGMMMLIAAQVPASRVLEDAEHLFDFYTDPEMMAEIAAIRDDKAAIVAYMERLLEDNIKLRALTALRKKAAN